MQKTPTSKNTRRKFLSLGLLGSAALITPDAHAQPLDPGEGETVKMLTPEGKLVEVSKKVVAQAENKHAARNEDILEWTKTINTSK